MDITAAVVTVALELARIFSRVLYPVATPSERLLALLNQHGYFEL